MVILTMAMLDNQRVDGTIMNQQHPRESGGQTSPNFPWDHEIQQCPIQTSPRICNKSTENFKKKNPRRELSGTVVSIWSIFPMNNVEGATIWGSNKKMLYFRRFSNFSPSIMVGLYKVVPPRSKWLVFVQHSVHESHEKNRVQVIQPINQWECI